MRTYGTGQSLHDGRVVPELVRAYYEGRPLPVHGDGQQTRSFCYVSDMVRGLIALMERGGDNGQPVNLGSTHEISMLDLATTVLSVGSELDRPVPNATIQRFGGRCPEDPQRRLPDTTRAQQRLGWRPWVGLREGLALTMACASAPFKAAPAATGG